MSVSPPDPAPALVLGFLTVLHDPGGHVGGYLVTNGWGRPLEFRLTTAVQPNRVQQILYAGTLDEYLHADLIGKTLVEKTAARPGLIVVDSLPLLALRSRIEIPVVGLVPGDRPGDPVPFAHPRCSRPLAVPAGFADDRPVIDRRLAQIDQAVDLAEPFARIREAAAEARKTGVSGRAA